MFHRYDYEAEFYPALSRLPLDLRRKLDVTGVKLSLKTWQTFSIEERTVLCHFPCDSGEEKNVFIVYLDFLSRRSGAITEMTEPLVESLWDSSYVPQAVGELSAALGLAVSLEQWRRWKAHDRYALYKTSVSTNQPEAFEQVLRQLQSNENADA